MTRFLEGQKNIDEPQTQVKEASCYGNLASCETPGQKCCRTTYERVCQQVGDNDEIMIVMSNLKYHQEN